MNVLQEPKTMVVNPLADLEGSVRGQLIRRDDKDAFAAARFRGWNRDLNVRANPLGFVVVSGVRDIVTTVNYCRSNNIPIAVRGKGAHSPYGMANDVVVIDLKNMTAVRVDPDEKLAYIQAGPTGGTSIMRSPSTT
jgi:FAD/FMN-containing dehydrogenase